MLERTETRFGIKPASLAADSRLRLGGEPGLARQTQGDRATHSGLRQIKSNRWHVLPRRFRLRHRTRPLHLPRGQRACSIPTHLRPSQKRRHSRGHKTLSRQQIGLRCLQAQSPVLPERSCPQDPAGSGRRCSRRGPRALSNSAIRGGLSPAEENRDAVRPSQANPSPHALAPQGPERCKRRVPACGDRTKPETSRPLKTNQHPSGNAGRLTPPLPTTGRKQKQKTSPTSGPVPQPKPRQTQEFFNGIRPIETSKAAVCYIRNTSTLAVRLSATNVSSGSRAVGSRANNDRLKRAA